MTPKGSSWKRFRQERFCSSLLGLEIRKGSNAQLIAVPCSVVLFDVLHIGGENVETLLALLAFWWNMQIGSDWALHKEHSWLSRALQQYHGLVGFGERPGHH